MGLLDWLTDGSLGSMGGMGSGETGAPPPGNMPSPAPQSPSSAPAPAPDPTPAAGPPDPPLPQGTDPMSAGGPTPNGPGLPSPTPAAPPPPQPTFAPNQTNTNPISPPAPGFKPSPLAPGGGALTQGDGNAVVKSYEAAGGHAFAPPDGSPGSANPNAPYKLGDQTALGRALGIDPNSAKFKETLGGLGAGFTAAGNSKGKSAGQAFASGAGGALEGSNKEDHAIEKDNLAYLNAAISAQKAGDTKTYQENMNAYQQGKLQLEQKQSANKDAATVANKNDSPTQLYLAAQRNVASDPLVKGSLSAYQAAIKDGDPTRIATAKSAYEQTVQERQAAHLAGVGLHPQTAAQIAQQPGMSKANPLDAGKAGITPANIGKKLQPGQFYTNPTDGKIYQFKGSPTKSQSKPSSATPSVDKIKSDLDDDARSDALAKEGAD